MLFLCFVTEIHLILCFRLDTLTELGSHYANRIFYVFFVLSKKISNDQELIQSDRIISGPRVKFVQRKAFNPRPLP